MVEAALGMGLLGAVAVGALQLTNMSTSSLGSQESKINSQALMTQIEGHLENVFACQNTLAGKDAATGGSVADIKNKTNSSVIIPGKVYDGVTLLSLNLIPPNPQTGSYLNLPARIGFVDLEAKLRGKPASGPIEVTKRVRLWVMTDAPGSSVIQKCSTIATSSDSLWRRSYWDASNIFYGGGNVGVGAPVGANPQSFIVANGKLQVSSVDGKKMQMENAGTSSSYKIRVLEDRPIAFHHSVASERADIEMGQLIPNDLIKVGPRPGACTQAILGAIRYNPAINRNQTCARVEVMGTVSSTPTCIRYEVPEAQYRVTYAPAAGSNYKPASPFQESADSDVASAYSPVGGSCPATVTLTMTFTYDSLSAPYQCDPGTGAANPSGTRWCKQCVYNPPPSIIREYDKPDPDDPVGEPGETVTNPLTIDSITYTETGRADYQPPNGPCLAYEEVFSPASAAMMFKWVTAP